MRKILSLIVTLFPMYSMANSFDLPTVHSIKNGNQCEISFNDKVVSKHDCEYESPSYLTSYSLLTLSLLTPGLEFGYFRMPQWVMLVRPVQSG